MKNRIFTTLIIVAAIFLLAIWGLDRCGFAPATQLTNGVLRPFMRQFSATGVWVGERFSSNSARDNEIANLSKKLLECETQLAKNRQMTLKFKQLVKASQTKPPIGWRLQIAEVIGRDPISWKQRFRINIGSATSGLKIGSAVLADGKVIGKIVSCSEQTAVVATMADQDCQFSVRLMKANIPGVLNGCPINFKEGVIKYLSRDSEVMLGEKVITSGIGDNVPGGLVIGEVLPWTQDNPAIVKNIVDGIDAQVRVKLYANFSKVHFVAVTCIMELMNPDNNNKKME